MAARQQKCFRADADTIEKLQEMVEQYKGELSESEIIHHAVRAFLKLPVNPLLSNNSPFVSEERVNEMIKIALDNLKK